MNNLINDEIVKYFDEVKKHVKSKYVYSVTKNELTQISDKQYKLYIQISSSSDESDINKFIEKNNYIEPLKGNFKTKIYKLKLPITIDDVEIILDDNKFNIYISFTEKDIIEKKDEEDIIADNIYNILLNTVNRIPNLNQVYKISKPYTQYISDDKYETYYQIAIDENIFGRWYIETPYNPNLDGGALQSYNSDLSSYIIHLINNNQIDEFKQYIINIINSLNMNVSIENIDIKVDVFSLHIFVTFNILQSPEELAKPGEIIKKFSNIMTLYEYAKIIGERARLLESNAPPTIDVKGEIDPVKIAKKELLAKRLPLTIIRKLTNNSYEEWDPNTMILPD